MSGGGGTGTKVKRVGFRRGWYWIRGNYTSYGKKHRLIYSAGVSGNVVVPVTIDERKEKNC